MAGVKVPLVAMKHAYVVSEKIEGIQNMPNVRDHDASVYLKLQGDALCIGGYEPNPVFWEQVSFVTDFGHCASRFLFTVTFSILFGPGRRAPNATLVVLVVLGISSLKIPKAFLIRSAAQRNFAHIRADIPHRSTVSYFQTNF